MERLDKVLSSGGIFTRSECKKAVLKGRIQVNGKRVKSPDEKVDASVDEITVDGERVTINRGEFFEDLRGAPGCLALRH